MNRELIQILLVENHFGNAELFPEILDMSQESQT